MDVQTSSTSTVVKMKKFFFLKIVEDRRRHCDEVARRLVQCYREQGEKFSDVIVTVYAAHQLELKIASSMTAFEFDEAAKVEGNIVCLHFALGERCASLCLPVGVLKFRECFAVPSKIK